MAMFKKDKGPKAEKAAKAEKAPKKAGSSSDYKPFWVVWQEKRQQAKMPRRESSLPKEPMPKEDIFKLAGCAVLVIAALTILIVSNSVANKQPKKLIPAAAPKDNTPQMGDD